MIWQCRGQSKVCDAWRRRSDGMDGWMMMMGIHLYMVCLLIYPYMAAIFFVIAGGLYKRVRAAREQTHRERERERKRARTRQQCACSACDAHTATGLALTVAYVLRRMASQTKGAVLRRNNAALWFCRSASPPGDRTTNNIAEWYFCHIVCSCQLSIVHMRQLFPYLVYIEQP